MADVRAVPAVCEAVLRLLKLNLSRADFNDTDLEFRVFSQEDFATAPQAGVSLFLYRIFPNGIHRTPAARVGPAGRRLKTQLPVDLHFFLTAWAGDPSLQNMIAGWAMRVLEDYPVIPMGILDDVAAGAFRPDETVEIVLSDLTNEDLFRIWETLVADRYRISVPYIARNVRLDSSREETAGVSVQERSFDYHGRSRT